MAKGPVVCHSLERGEITASRAGGKSGNARIAKQGIGRRVYFDGGPRADYRLAFQLVVVTVPALSGL